MLRSAAAPRQACRSAVTGGLTGVGHKEGQGLGFHTVLTATKGSMRAGVRADLATAPRPTGALGRRSPRTAAGRPPSTVAAPPGHTQTHHSLLRTLPHPSSPMPVHRRSPGGARDKQGRRHAAAHPVVRGRLAPGHEALPELRGTRAGGRIRVCTHAQPIISRHLLLHCRSQPAPTCLAATLTQNRTTLKVRRKAARQPSSASQVPEAVG